MHALLSYGIHFLICLLAQVEQLTHKLRCSQDLAHKDRKSMRIEIQRLANEIQQGLTTAASEKQLLNEEVCFNLLCHNFLLFLR